MKAFEYAAPRREEEVVDLLSTATGRSELIAGGTDLIGLMKKMVITPDRVVNIKEVSSLRGISADSQYVRIGATTTLDDVLDSSEINQFPSIQQATRGINSPQLQAQGTFGGELCQRPRCWYFRNGHGLLAGQGRMVAEGDNRFHAIFGNAGPAKFVCPSRLAPALIALESRVRIIGPGPQDESMIPLELFYRTPRDSHQHENILLPNQLLTHVEIPLANGAANATYEVRHGVGPDYPLVAAAAVLWIDGGIVRRARIVLGQVAPTPWIAEEAASVLVGQSINHNTAEAAARAAVAKATPMSNNRYKVQLARVAVERSILLAAGLETGGF